MAKPAQNLSDRFDCSSRGNVRPSDHDHRQCKVSRRFDLGRGSISAGVARNDNVGTEILKHGPITGAVERPARHDHLRIGQRQRIARRINQPNQIGVLRIRREGLQVLSANREEHAARLGSKSLRRCRDIIDLGPMIAGHRLPGCAFERQQRYSGDVASRNGIRAHPRRERMRRIDDAVDIFCTKIVREARDAAKATDAPRDRRWQRILCPPSIGQYGIDMRIAGQGCRQPVRIGGATKDQDTQSSGWRGYHDREQ